MVFFLERGGSKVDQTDIRVQQDSTLTGDSGRGCRGRGNVPVVRECLIVVGHKQDILGLEIGVDQIEIVQNWQHSSVQPGRLRNALLTCNAGEKLTSKALYLAAWKRHKSVAFEKIKDTLTE